MERSCRWWEKDCLWIAEFLGDKISDVVTSILALNIQKSIFNSINSTKGLRDEISGINDGKYSERERALGKYFSHIDISDSDVKRIVDNVGIDGVNADNVIDCMDLCDSPYYLLQENDIVIPIPYGEKGIPQGGHNYPLNKMYIMLDYEYAKSYKGVTGNIMSNTPGGVIAANDDDIARFIVRRDLIAYDDILSIDELFKTDLL